MIPYVQAKCMNMVDEIFKGLQGTPTVQMSAQQMLEGLTGDQRVVDTFVFAFMKPEVDVAVGDGTYVFSLKVKAEKQKKRKKVLKVPNGLPTSGLTSGLTSGSGGGLPDVVTIDSDSESESESEDEDIIVVCQEGDLISAMKKIGDKSAALVNEAKRKANADAEREAAMAKLMEMAKAYEQYKG
jgi:hypothetical protein